MPGFAPDRIPAAGVGKWQISTAGGEKPPVAARWHRTVHIAPDRKMMAVPIKLGPPFEPGLAVPLFDTYVAGSLPMT